MKELLRIFTCDIDPEQKIRLLYASASLLKYDYANNKASEDINKVVEEMVKALQSKMVGKSGVVYIVEANYNEADRFYAIGYLATRELAEEFLKDRAASNNLFGVGHRIREERLISNVNEFDI